MGVVNAVILDDVLTCHAPLVMTEKGGMTREDIIKDYGIHYTHSVSVPRF